MALTPNKKGGLQSIGNRITIANHGDAITVVIDQNISSNQRLSLEMWLGGWTGLGGLLAYGAITFDGNESWFYIFSLVFWGFFWVRIAKVVAWRRFGKEIMRVSEKGVWIKNAIKTYGKDKFFSINKVGAIKFQEKKISSFIQQLDNSFWIIGGDTLHFSYDGKTHVLGKQLPPHDAKQLANVLNKAIKRFSNDN